MSEQGAAETGLDQTAAGRSTRRTMTVAATIIAVGLLAVTACNRESTASSSSGTTLPATVNTVVPTDEGAPRDGGLLAFGVDAEPDGLDPKSSQFVVNSHLIASSVFESLAAFDADKNPQPSLAESIVPSDLAARWTIKVKPNITFQDGTPFNADAVKANLDASIAGLGGTISLKPIESVNVVDDRTVEVKMNQPWASFPSILASQQGYQAAPASLKDPDASSHPVGTGPFAFDRWDRGTSISVKKNPTYWKSGQPHLDGIKFMIMTDPDTRANALNSGDLDMMTNDRAETIADFRNKSGFKVVIDQQGDAKSIIFNESTAPFDNINARRAVILATDPAALTETIGAGILQPIDQPFATASAYHQSDPKYPKADVEAAKKAAAQYTTETGNPLTFTLAIYADSTSLKTAQVLQDQWAKAGIKAEINGGTQADVANNIIFGKTQAAFESNYGFPDPDWNYIFWHSSYTGAPGTLSINFAHLKLDALDKTLLDGRVSLIPQQRQDAYKAAVRQLNDNASYVWLYRTVLALIAADRVHGLGQAERTGFNAINSKPWYGELWVDRK